MDRFVIRQRSRSCLSLAPTRTGGCFPEETRRSTHAASICACESLRLLLAHGADPNLRDDSGFTPLHNAVLRVRNSSYNGLSEQRWIEAACNEQERHKRAGWRECRTRATVARKECTMNIVTMLGFGANPSTGAHVGESPLDIARQYQVGNFVIRKMKDALAKKNR